MASRKNLHQTHMEDLVLLGKEGINELNNHILNFTKRLKGREGAYLSTKIDGAPALFCIHNVDGYPETCVGIKSVLNNPNNAYSTPEEIDAKFGDRPSIADKMKYALELAKSIPNGEVWQGDCLFSGQPKEQEINGKHYVTFQPNKILYAFSEDNAGYEKIKNSVFGIAFHTRYIRSGDGWKQSFNVNPEVLTNVPDNFYIMSPALNMNSIDDYDMSAFTNKVKELDKLEEALLSDPAYEELVNNDVFINYWNTFENKFISDKKRTTLDVNTFFNDLKSYVAKVQADAYDKKMSTLKTDRGRINATSKYAEEVEEMENLLDSHKEVLVKLVKTINCASEIKMIMLAGLKKIKHDYSTFATTVDSVEEVGDEGIAMSDADGNIVKLVDRSEFSNINRDPKYLAGFQHENLEEDKNVNDKQVYNLVYAKLLDIAEDARLKKKNNHKHYETIREYLKKQYRSNKLSRTMFTKLSRLVDSYDKKHESFNVKNLEHNSDTNTDKDPAVKATKAYHNMKLKKLKPGQMIVSSLDLDEKIVKKGSEWQVQSEKGRNMGTYDTKKEAEKRLKQVHYFKYKNEDLNEDANVDFTISVVTTFSGLNEDIISGNIEGSDADNLIEYYEFIDDVEDLIKKNGTIIESNPTTAISSLSEYFNFYINDSEGNKVSGLISLRVSDHDETRKGTYIQRIKANKLDANNKLISITVNSKKFESYDQALKHIKDIISNETGVELKESMKLNKLILDEDLELDETIINRIQKVIEDVKADQGPFKMTWTNDTGVVNAEGIGISEKYSFIIAPSTSSTTSLKMSEIVDELDDKLSDEFTESTITVERKKMDSTGYLHKIVIRKFHSSEKLNAFDDLDNFEEDYEVNSPEAKHINSIIYKLVNRLRDMNYKVMSRTLFHTGKHDIGVKGTKETAQKLYLFFKNMLKKEGINTYVTLERCTDNVYDYNITVFFPNEKDKARLLAFRDLDDDMNEEFGFVKETQIHSEGEEFANNDIEKQLFRKYLPDG